MNRMLISVLAFALTLIPLGDSVSAQEEFHNEGDTTEEVGGGAGLSVGPLKSPPEGGDIRSHCRGTLLPTPPVTIEGINFIEDLTLNNMIGPTPPDSFGVAGHDNLVSVVNISIDWFSKDGTAPNRQSLFSFFAPLSPSTKTLDPKRIYDQFADRFVVVTLEGTESGLSGTTRILNAVSEDPDCNGTWHFRSVNAATIIAAVNHWVDYPGLALDNETDYMDLININDISMAISNFEKGVQPFPS